MEYQLTRSFSVQHLSLALYSLGITSVLLHSSGTLPLSPFEIHCIFSCFDFSSTRLHEGTVQSTILPRSLLHPFSEYYLNNLQKHDRQSFMRPPPPKIFPGKVTKDFRQGTTCPLFLISVVSWNNQPHWWPTFSWPRVSSNLPLAQVNNETPGSFW